MINAQMRDYKYYTYANENAYGQPQLSEEPQGTIKMAINITSQSLQDNILYNKCSYIGLTTDAGISNKYVIEYDAEHTEEDLKVVLEFVQYLEYLEKWDGKLPTVITGSEGVEIIIPSLENNTTEKP